MHRIIWCHLNLWFINRCHRKLRVDLGWSWCPGSRQSSSIQGTQAPCPCWSAPQHETSGLHPSVAALWDVWHGQPLRFPLIWWGGGSLMHVLQLSTSPVSLSGMYHGVPSAWSSTSSWFHQCRPCHSCRGSSTLLCYITLQLHHSHPGSSKTRWKWT